MFADEILILMTIEEAGELTEKPTNHPKDITDNHIGYLYDSLVRHGYLTANSQGGYHLTWQGRNAILREVVILLACEDETWVKDRVERLEQLYDEVRQQIDSLKGGNKGFSVDEECGTILYE